MKNELRPGVDYIGISTPFYCIDGNGKLLMHKRSDKCRDEHGKWDTGSGQLDFGEDPEVGVLREVREEYGCDGKIIFQFPPISVIREQNGVDTHWLALPFIIKVDPKEVKNNEPHKIIELEWFTLDNLPQPLHSAMEKYIVKTDRIKFLEKFI